MAHGFDHVLVGLAVSAGHGRDGKLLLHSHFRYATTSGQLFVSRRLRSRPPHVLHRFDLPGDLLRLCSFVTDALEKQLRGD